MKSVLVVAAHPDDEILGEGGTICRLSYEGVACHALILGEGLTARKMSRAETQKDELERLKNDTINASKKVGYLSVDFLDLPDNRFDSLDLLDIIKKISTYIDKYRPDTIFTHHHGDLNIDHRCTCEAVLTACRPVGTYFVKRIYAFETPSSTEWNYTYGEPFIPNVFFDVTATMDKKIEGMLCYQSESAAYPHPRSTESLQALASYRGSNVGVRKAEAFMLLREIF